MTDGPVHSKHEDMQGLLDLDHSLLHWVNVQLANPYFDSFFPAITDLHKTFYFKAVFLPAVFALLVFFHRLRGALIFLGLAVSLGVGDFLGGQAKHFWQRTRPFEAGLEVIQRSGAGGYSFPSNHALNMFCTALFLSAFFPKLRWLLLLLATLVAYSRVYNGVHFPLDVIAGGLIGAFLGLLGAELCKRVLRKFQTAKAK